MKKHYLSENILKINKIIEECNIKERNGLLVSFNFYKAFDTVEWSALYAALSAFNFGEKYIDMVRIVFHKPLLVVTNNGYWSESTEITRGCRQECCFSPGGFLVLAETLGAAI